MHESALDDVIARTEIRTREAAKDAPSLELHFGRPIPAEVDWQCSHQLTGLPREDRIMTASGVDSFQALYLCILMARARLREIEHRNGIPLLGWNEESGGFHGDR